MELQYRIDKLNKELEKNNDSEDSDNEIFDIDIEMDEKDEKDDKDEKNIKDTRKKIRRLKVAKALYNKDDARITHYEKQEMINIIQDMRYHSLELSEMDEETSSDKCQIVLKTLLREVLDLYSFIQQNAQLIRRKNYDDTLQNFNVQPPNDAPQWTCIDPENGNIVYDSDIGYESIYDDIMCDTDTF
ncbi:hypothetical protein C1646_767423 [Rhizophagus diaphanus]|nr:hypothetical protein C1646_767423 [Rhizophagus diaphanus] [Rhizophagus sp. MUCL 43196]